MNDSLLRTPDHYFEQLPDFPFTPHYQEVIDGQYGPLRMHYLDEGPRDGPIVLLLHGEPTWSFLYRKVIPPLVAAGYRAIAPDHIGFGRSDKLPQRSDYSYQKFVNWMLRFIQRLDLRDTLLVCQDWGGPIGLRTLANDPDRFNGVLVTNTLLPNCDPPPKGVANWPGELIENWVEATKEAPDLPVSDIVEGVCVQTMPADVKAAYDAPFPTADYKAAVLEFPSLIPTSETMTGTEENRKAWRLLEQWNKPFATAFSDNDPSTKAWEQVFQQRIPGAKSCQHSEIAGAGHFVQEDQGEALAQAILNLLSSMKEDGDD